MSSFEQDYVKRVIDSISKMIFAISGGRNAIENNIEDENYNMKISEDDLLEVMVKKYLDDDNINEAENIIFEALKTHKSNRNYEIAVEFYHKINTYSDEKLESYNFSRNEIVDGIKTIEKMI